MEWNEQFLALFDRCLKSYQSGNTDFTSYYSEEDLAFLASIGYKPRELFDFVEDHGDCGQPTRSTALLVAAVRRDYLFAVQDGQLSNKEITSAELPSKTHATDGIVYMQRIIEKAKAKLRGELDPDLMFGCGGDRRFLRENGNIPMADFLRNVWAAKGDDQRVIDYVKACKAAN